MSSFFSHRRYLIVRATKVVHAWAQNPKLVRSWSPGREGLLEVGLACDGSRRFTIWGDPGEATAVEVVAGDGGNYDARPCLHCTRVVRERIRSQLRAANELLSLDMVVRPRGSFRRAMRMSRGQS